MKKPVDDWKIPVIRKLERMLSEQDFQFDDEDMEDLIEIVLKLLIKLKKNLK